MLSVIGLDIDPAGFALLYAAVDNLYELWVLAVHCVAMAQRNEG